MFRYVLYTLHSVNWKGEAGSLTPKKVHFGTFDKIFSAQLFFSSKFSEVYCEKPWFYIDDFIMSKMLLLKNLVLFLYDDMSNTLFHWIIILCAQVELPPGEYNMNLRMIKKEWKLRQVVYWGGWSLGHASILWKSTMTNVHGIERMTWDGPAENLKLEKRDSTRRKWRLIGSVIAI